MRSGFRSIGGDDQGYLAPDFVAQRGAHLSRGSTQNLLVHLGQLTPQREASVWHHFGDQSQGLADSVRRLERDRGPLVTTYVCEKSAHLSRFAWQVSDESEPRAAKARDRQRRGDRAGAGYRHHVVAGSPRRFDQRLSWI